VVQINTFGMIYGAVFVAVYALARGRSFRFEHSASYLLSLSYLSLFGSVIAFGASLTLIGRIGPERAGYTNAAVPVVALLMSACFEGLKWHVATVVGIALCLFGSVLVLRRKPQPKN
jgi:drug/metabolite transporter (DMT)-like permease